MNKETLISGCTFSLPGYCEPWNPMFAETTFAVSTLCSSIMADSALFYMFRMGPNLEPTACPFDGTHTFSYSTRGGKDICGRPTSQLEQCTDPTRLVFQFQACPDVPGSESAGEVIKECGSMFGRPRPGLKKMFQHQVTYCQEGYVFLLMEQIDSFESVCWHICNAFSRLGGWNCSNLQ